MSGREERDARGDWMFDGEGEPSAEEREVLESLRGAEWRGDVEGLMKRAEGIQHDEVGALAGEPPVAPVGGAGASPPSRLEDSATLSQGERGKRHRRRVGLVIAAAAAVLLAVNVWAFFVRAGTPDAVWTRASGGAWAVGEWVETGGAETVEVASDIGRVTVGPDSRVLLRRAGEDEHRLELAEGSIEAFIYAPPRLFFVDTPAATAVDMGCAYKLDVEPDGRGVLRVSGGWVELQGEQGVARVPAGAVCRIGHGGELGIPRFEDAPAGLLAAVDRIEQGEGAALDAALAAARERDSLTLWHLLARTEGEARGRVAERLSALVPVEDAGVREGALVLDSGALEAWWAEVKRSW